ncbi:hypothetical protein ACIGN6_20925 [Streptomyces sp. NPDC053792]|uniref:hypothetical protein n=1 Tax=Streptomyces sp. NPDC053792 TaxID=3365716 RepID=UPI0037D89735
MSLADLFTTLAVHGRWTWTHGGGPGSDDLPARRTTRAARTWPRTAGVVGVQESTAREATAVVVA